MTIGSNTSGHFFDTSLNADGVLYASSSGVITSTAVGTSGNVLTSNGAGVAPTFQAVSAGVTGPGSSTNTGVATWNGTGGTALNSPPSPLISSGGVMTNANQPAFMAYLASTSTNVLGSSANYTMQGLTKSFDRGTNLNATTGVFTAPVTGIYYLGCIINISGYGATNTTCDISIPLSSGITVYPINNINEFITGNNGNFGLSGGCLVTLSSTQTASVVINIAGNACSLFGFTNSVYTGFYGYLVC